MKPCLLNDGVEFCSFPATNDLSAHKDPNVETALSFEPTDIHAYASSARTYSRFVDEYGDNPLPEKIFRKNASLPNACMRDT